MLTFAAQAAFLAALASPPAASPAAPAPLPVSLPALLNIVTTPSEMPTLDALFSIAPQSQDEAPAVMQLDGDKVLIAFADKTNLSDLVGAYAQLEGMRILVDEQSQMVLESTALKMFGAPSRLTRDEVTPFVEGILRDADFIMTANGGTDSFSLWSLRAARGSRRASVQLASNDIAALRRHPALVMQTTMTFENIDVRQLSTNLRPIFQDPGYQSIMNMGSSNALLMRGTGLELANVIEMLRAADAAAAPTEDQQAARRAPSQAQPQTAQAVQAPAGPKANTERPKVVTRIFEITGETNEIANTAEGLTRGRFNVEAQGLFFQASENSVASWPKPHFWTDRDTHRVMVQAPERDFAGIEADLQLAARLHRQDG